MADPERLLRARRLLRVFDVRPVDPLTGTRPTAAEYKAFADAPRCHRCGQEHVKVYEVECDDGRPYTVGSGCVARTFGGWEPGKEDLVRVRKAETKARRIAEEEARKACAAHAAALNDLFMLIGHAKVEPPPPPGGVGMAPDFLGRIKEGSMQHKVLKHMADGASRDWDAHEIADTTGVPILRVRSILSKLFAAERIARTAGGRYRIKS